MSEANFYTPLFPEGSTAVAEREAKRNAIERETGKRPRLNKAGGIVQPRSKTRGTGRSPRERGTNSRATGTDRGQNIPGTDRAYAHWAEGHVRRCWWARGWLIEWARAERAFNIAWTEAGQPRSVKGHPALAVAASARRAVHRRYADKVATYATEMAKYNVHKGDARFQPDPHPLEPRPGKVPRIPEDVLRSIEQRMGIKPDWMWRAYLQHPRSDVLLSARTMSWVHCMPDLQPSPRSAPLFGSRVVSYGPWCPPGGAQQRGVELEFGPWQSQDPAGCTLALPVAVSRAVVIA